VRQWNALWVGGAGGLGWDSDAPMQVRTWTGATFSGGDAVDFAGLSCTAGSLSLALRPLFFFMMVQIARKEGSNCGT